MEWDVVLEGMSEDEMAYDPAVPQVGTDGRKDSQDSSRPLHTQVHGYISHYSPKVGTVDRRGKNKMWYIHTRYCEP